MPYFNYNGHQVFYHETGEGSPLFLLHGNSVSSKLFDGVIDMYSAAYKVVLIDFLGHGKSDRLAEFATDFWYDEAMQTVRLIEETGYGKVDIIGTSGGAIAALNVALERGDLVRKVVADSFEGERALKAVTEYIPQQREQSKASEQGRMVWEYCHGDDWESVVDNDTAVCLRHYQSIGEFFHKDLSGLSVPVLLTASKEDEFAQIAGLDFERLYPAMAGKIPGGRVRLFESGNHPAMLTSAQAFFETAKAFLNEPVGV